MEKYKILYIITGLQKAGAEKYLYELVSSIDKNKFEVEILTTKNVYLNSEFPHYYLKPIEELGIKIHTKLYPKSIDWLDSFKGKKGFLPKIFNFLSEQINGYFKRRHQNSLKIFFHQFDLISLIDALHFKKIKYSLSDDIFFETHLMCHQSQFNFNIYKPYKKNKPLNFVYIDQVQIDEIKQKGFSIDHAHHFPLSLNDNELAENSKYNHQNHKSQYKIGLFARINRSKPLNIVLKAFQLVHQTNSSVDLHLFGFIQDADYHVELLKEIKELKLENNVFFEGHSPDMLQSVVEKNIDLVWVISIFDFVGFAALELSSNGIPLILNNIEAQSFKPLNDATANPPYFHSPNQLATYTLEMLDAPKLQSLAALQFKKYSSERRISDSIKKYENYVVNSYPKKRPNE